MAKIKKRKKGFIIFISAVIMIRSEFYEEGVIFDFYR